MKLHQWEIGLSMCFCCPPGRQRKGMHTQSHSNWFHAPGGEWLRLKATQKEARELIETFGNDPAYRRELVDMLKETSK